MWDFDEREQWLWPLVFQAVDRLPEQPTVGAGWMIKAQDQTLRTILPPSFEAHARIMHPGWARVPRSTEGAVVIRKDTWAKPVFWSEIAAATGLRVDGRTALGPIYRLATEANRAAPPAPIWTYPPEEDGTSDPTTIAALFAHLASATPPDVQCWCGFWEGYGMQRPATVQFRAANDAYWLYGAKFGDLANWWQQRDTRLGQTGLLPNMFWPERGGWYIAMPYSRTSSYMAGSRSLIDAILKDSKLEAYEIRLSDNCWH